MIRVVFDTNVVISALLQPAGPPAKLFIMALGGALEFCVTGNVYAEYEDVLNRPKFRFGSQTVDATLHAVRQQGQWVRQTQTVYVCSDPTDNKFLECAVAANAGYLVTGNLKHFPPRWGETQVVTPRILLDLLPR